MFKECTNIQETQEISCTINQVTNVCLSHLLLSPQVVEDPTGSCWCNGGCCTELNLELILAHKITTAPFLVFHHLTNTKLFCSIVHLFCISLQTEILCSKICLAFYLHDQFSLSKFWSGMHPLSKRLYCSNPFEDTQMRRNFESFIYMKEEEYSIACMPVIPNLKDLEKKKNNNQNQRKITSLTSLFPTLAFVVSM